MTIGSVSGVSSYGTTTGVSYSSNTTSIEEEIAKIEQQIRELQQDDEMDDQLKSQQIAVYQAQISTLRAQATQATQAVDTSAQAAQTSATQQVDVQDKFDRVDISGKGREAMGRPPMLDFSAMSDEEFKTWLTNMQNETGSIPGAEGETSVSSLSDEQLSALRETLSAQQQERMGGLDSLPPPPPGERIASMSDDDLISLLEKLQERTGSIPGADSGTDLENISREQLNGIREALVADMEANRPVYTPMQQYVIGSYLANMAQE